MSSIRHASADEKPGDGNVLRLVRANVRLLIPGAGLIVLLAIFGVLSPEFLTLANAVNILLDTSVLLVLSLAATAVILTGAIDLSIGSTLALSAFVGAMACEAADSNLPLLVIPFVGLICGFLNGVVVAYLRLPSFLVTLGSYFIYNGMANYWAGGQPVTIPQGGVSTWFAGFVGAFPMVAVWALAVFAVAVLVFRYVRYGRYILAVGGNEKTSRLTGVPVDRVKLYAFTGAGLLAGIAAVLQITKVQSASPDMGMPFLLPAIAAVVMGGTPLTGGVGGPLRTLLGVLVIGVLTNGMVMVAVNPYLQNVIEGAVVVVAVALTMKRSRSVVVK